MAVSINLDLDAGSAMSKVALLRGQLTQLGQKVEEIDDLDFDFSGSISEIASEVQSLITSLEEMEAKMDNLSGQVKQAAAQLDNATVNVDMPDGTVGGNDAENDPPNDEGNGSSGGGDESNGDDDGKTTRDDFDRQQINERVADLVNADGIMGEGLMEELFKLRGHKSSNLGTSSTQFPDYSFLQRAYTSGDFGIEPLSMRKKRAAADVDLSGQTVGFTDDDDSDGDSPINLPFTQRQTGFSNSDEAMQSLSDTLESVMGKLQSLKPTMGRYMQLFAALGPMIGAAAVQAAGFATALGGVAAAGGALIGLGLLGHAESMGGAFASAEQRLKAFKRELFAVFQPTFETFAPISQQFLEYAPDRLDGIASAMRGLTAYEGTLYRIFNLAADGAERLVRSLVKNQKTVSLLATAVARFVSTGLPKFLKMLVNEAASNAQLFALLVKNFMLIAQIAYDIIKAVSRLVVVFTPLIAVLAKIASLLNKPIVMGVLTAITVFSSLALVAGKVTVAMYSLMGSMAAFGTGGFLSSVVGGISYMIGALYGYVEAAWAAVGASGALLTALSALTLGTFAVAGVAAGAATMGAMKGDAKSLFGGGSQVGSSREVTYYDNRTYEINSEGSMNTATEQRIRSTVKEMNGTTKAMSAPDPGTSGNDSTTTGGR